MIIPFILFWVLIVIGREELGFKGVLISVIIWIALLLVSILVKGISSYHFIAANALLDIVLLIVIFRQDVNIPLR